TTRYVATGDFNHDGILDLAFSVNAGLAVMLGQGSGGVGNGAFGAGATFAAGTNPQGLAVADLNEDGIEDIAIVNGSSNSVSIFLGLGSGGVGNGSFAAAVNYATGTGPAHVV